MGGVSVWQHKKFPIFGEHLYKLKTSFAFLYLEFVLFGVFSHKTGYLANSNHLLKIHKNPYRENVCIYVYVYTLGYLWFKLYKKRKIKEIQRKLSIFSIQISIDNAEIFIIWEKTFFCSVIPCDEIMPLELS